MNISDRRPVPSDTAGRFKVLVVEDHSATRDAILAVLGGAFPTCLLQAVSNAEDALAHCNTDTPDVVVMDISLPGMNGIEATALIRAQYPQTQVVMHSSNDAQIFKDESAAAGAFAFISKGQAAKALLGVMGELVHVVPKA